MQLPINIACVALNFQRLDEEAMNDLSNAYLNNDPETISKFKEQVGFPVEQFAIIEKCNAVILVLCYQEDLSKDLVRGRVLDTWDRLSRGGIIKAIRHIKFFENDEALKYIGECAIGLHSVTVGDSQVLAQIHDSLQDAADFQPGSPTLSLINIWIKELAAEVKLRTNIFSGNTSLERIAAERINREIEKSGKIALVGYGKAGRLIAKILSKEFHYHLKIANRSPEALDGLRNERDMDIVDFKDYAKIIDSSCIIFAITLNEETRKHADEFLLHLKESSSRPKFIIDFSSPPLLRNNADIRIVDIKDLSQEANENLNKRKLEINKTREIVNKYLDNISNDLKREIGKMSLNKLRKDTVFKLDSEKLRLIKIRNDVNKSIRDYFEKLEFIEVTTPYIVGISTDPPKVDSGGTIDVIWQDGSKAFLRQSNQIYKQMIVVSGLQKIYEIGPFWRAEATQSYRHLQEVIGLDVEFSKPKGLDEIYGLAYSIILDVKNNIDKIYGARDNGLILPDMESLPVITYQEAVDILNSKGHGIVLGEDLGLVGEAKLGQIIKREKNSDVFVIKNYPDTIKKFYTKKIEGGLTETFDIIMSGWELASGAIRETDRATIEKSMYLSGISPIDYDFYLSIVDGSSPHGGFGLGIDRLVAKMLDLEIVSDAVVFPRTFNRLIP